MRIVSLATALMLGLASQAAAQDRTLNLLKDLADAAGPSGFEEPVRRIMVDQMRPLAETITYDGLGSVIATQGRSGPRIMIAAHMDELGGMVRRTTPDGYITMQMLGGWLDQALIGQRWIIIGSKGPVRAVTGVRDIHVVSPDERTKVFPRESVFLDVGAATAAEVAAMGVSPGDPVVPDAPFVVLNGTQNYMGKAWDDRLGCAVLIEAMRRLKGTNHPNQIFYVATVQEEIGLRGAEASSALVKPDIGIAIEAGVVGDVPGARPEEIDDPLAFPRQFHQRADVDRFPGRKLPHRERLVLLHRLHDLRRLARLAICEIRRLQAAGVVLVLRLALIIGSVIARRLGGTRITLQLFPKGGDDFPDDGVLVQHEL